MRWQDQHLDFTSNSDTSQGLRAKNLQSTKPLMALASDTAQQDQRSRQVPKVLSCWQRLAGRHASLNHSFVRPTSIYLPSVRLNFHFVSYGLQVKKAKPNLFEVDLTNQLFRSEAKPWYSPMFSWPFHSFGGGYSQTTIATVPSQLLRFSQAAPPSGLQEH